MHSGAAAIARPTFNFQGVHRDQSQFLKTAVAFEDIAVAAYKGQAPRLTSDELLAVAVSIHSVRARHTAWMRYLFDITPAANAFDGAPVTAAGDEDRGLDELRHSARAHRTDGRAEIHRLTFGPLQGPMRIALVAVAVAVLTVAVVGVRLKRPPPQQRYTETRLCPHPAGRPSRYRSPKAWLERELPLAGPRLADRSWSGKGQTPPRV